MPYVFKDRSSPEPWRQYRLRVRLHILRPLLYVEWIAEWCAFVLARWAFLEVLEYCGTLGLLVGVIFYFAGAKDRREQKHYQAWQVINTAQGKGGSGGRIDALQDLNADQVPLVGVDLSDAFLQNVDLPKANLHRARLSSADMRSAILRGADLDESICEYTNLRGADLRDTRLDGFTDLANADLTGADLRGADLNKADFGQADLRNADLGEIKNWKSIGSIRLANLLGCKNPPDGFMDWATAHGAVQLSSDDEWAALIAASKRPAK